MHVVGYNARLLRDLDGNNTDYYSNSIHLGGGESVDVILEAKGTNAGQKFYLYTTELDHLSNDAENFGGMMTEVNICRVDGQSGDQDVQLRRTGMQATQSIAARLARGAISVLAILGIAGAAQAAAPGITGTDLRPRRRGWLHQPTRRRLHLHVGLRLQYGARRVRSPPRSPLRVRRADAAARPDADRPQGDTVTVTLHNNLPAAAGNTSILFPGFKVCAATLNPDGTCTGTASGTPGLLTQEATNGASVTYTFIADTEGTHSYYSGTQGDLQVEMGTVRRVDRAAEHHRRNVRRGTAAAYTAVREVLIERLRSVESRIAAPHRTTSDWQRRPTTMPSACYDREYLLQTSEIDPRIHEQAAAAGRRSRCSLRPGHGLHDGRDRALSPGVLPAQRAVHAG